MSEGDKDAAFCCSGLVWEIRTYPMLPFFLRRRTFFTLANYTNVMQFSLCFSRVLPGDLIHNIPVISLIFANIVTIVLAIHGNWDMLLR